MTLDYKILKDVIKKKDCVLLGVSGGPDSMCLLDLVDRYRKEVDFDCYVVHVNHNIRNQEAERDENFVRDCCKKRSISFICEHIDTIKYAKENLKTIEQAARELRYGVFDRLVSKLNANKLLIAHHKDDQAETVLMHILRGSSLKGARGMSKNSQSIYRPLLDFDRNDIENYNRKNQVEFITDSSNFDSKYTRNYIRNEVVPRLKTIYPNVVDAICAFAEKCAKDEEFIDNLVPKSNVEITKEGIKLLVKDLKKDFPLSSRLIKFAFEKLNVFADIEEKHIIDIINLCEKQNGKKIYLTNNLKAYKEYDKIVITKNEVELQPKNHEFIIGEFSFRGLGKIEVEKISKQDEIVFDKSCLYVDLDKIPQDSIWRAKREGDTFNKFASGKKNLSDYFINQKVSKRTRGMIPVLANGSNILVVAGMEISEDVKLTNSTRNVGRITYCLD